MNPKTKTKLKWNKNGSGRFLLCFRPSVIDINTNDVSLVRPVRGCTDESSEPVLTSVAMGEKQRVAFPRIVPAAAASAVAASLSGDDDDDINIQEENGVLTKKMNKKKKKVVSRQRLLGILKAVLFETSMAKKIRKRRFQQKICQPGDPLNESSLNKELSEVDDGSILSNTCSSLRSSSLSTSVCPSSLSSKSYGLNTFDRKQQKQDNVRIQQHGKLCYPPNIGLCLLLISLLVLVFWGKVCAIFCTSTWLFFVPRWTIGNNSLGNMSTDSLRLDSEEYKKKIILEGLLERNHSRGL
ncbi:vitellogenin-2-like [Melia azedarach]|uniref:Vitellogenin-2-like n=1 Tax=Melia azedarach TaxID=155640 RepID=A0ACC1YRY0_MELAZ|nr:vitellogenin-2-like [Melia azedarach]